MFNLPRDRIKNETIVEGSFNMLKAAVTYVRKRQNGYGVCTVSKNYAEEIWQKLPLLWNLHVCRASTTLCPTRSVLQWHHFSEAMLLDVRRKAKYSIQKTYGLTQDLTGERSRLFVFLGRWVKQKGM